MSILYQNDNEQNAKNGTTIHQCQNRPEFRNQLGSKTWNGTKNRYVSLNFCEISTIADIPIGEYAIREYAVWYDIVAFYVTFHANAIIIHGYQIFSKRNANAILLCQINVSLFSNYKNSRPNIV